MYVYAISFKFLFVLQWNCVSCQRMRQKGNWIMCKAHIILMPKLSEPVLSFDIGEHLHASIRAVLTL